MSKKILKKIFFDIYFLLNNKKMYNNIINKGYLTILNLHRISPQKNEFYNPLSPELFEILIKFLKEKYDIITFKDIENIKHVSKLNKPNVILSFDDGYYDFLEYACPILSKHKISVNMNIIPSCVKSQEPMWNIKMYDYLNAASDLLLKEINIPNFNYKYNGDKTLFGIKLSAFLKNKPFEERKKYLKHLDVIFEKIDNVTFTKMMNEENVKEISKIHEIGVHSYYHESMGVESQEFFEKDFYLCKDYFENVLKLPMNIYAFPNGSYKNENIQFLQRNNITHILLVNNDFSNYKTNIYNRFTFYGDSKNEIKLRALGFKK